MKFSQFKNTNLELARRFANAIIYENEPYCVDTLEKVYFSSLPSNSTESPEASGMWVKFFWSRIESITVTQWREAYGDKRAFVEFVHGFWGKDV